MSVSQAIVQTKPKEGRERGPQWLRSNTRKAILDAARELIARDGFEKLSLIRVAEAAGFASTTVYAYFVRKADLLSAIVADDLATFAKAIKEGFPFTEPSQGTASETGGGEHMEVDAGHGDVLEPDSAHEENTVEPHDMTLWSDESLDTPHVEAANDAKRESVEPAIAVEPARSEAPSTTEESSHAVAGFEARIAQLEARRVDPWLERRLREFERMLAALEERVTTSDRNNAASGAPLEARLLEFVGRFDTLEKNHAAAVSESTKSVSKDLEACETRLRQAWSELRTLTLEASGRLDTLERDRAMRALAEEMPVPDFVPQKAEAPKPEQPVPEGPVEVRAEESSSTPEKSDASEPADGATAESYIAAARRAAKTAHSLSQSDDRPRRRRSRASRNDRAYILVGICAALVLAGSLTGVALSKRAEQEPIAQTQLPITRLTRATLSPAPAPQSFNSIYSSARTGNGRAQLEVGLAYLNGNGVKKDETIASRWLESAASSGDPVAQYWLGTLFEHGRAEIANPSMAVHWYEAAALQGNLKAMYKLAVAYAEGWGVHQNYGEAARWFSRAAELGFTNAQYNLGVLYERGMGVPQSLLDAYKWYGLAAAQGDKDSAARVEALTSQLSADDLASAREAIGAFKAEPTNEDANEAPAVHVASAPAVRQATKN